MTGGAPRWRALAARAGVWAASHAMVRAEEFAFDYLFYPYMLYVGGPALAALAGLDEKTGFGIGFAILVAASALLNILYVQLYDSSKRDWFGFEAARQWLAVRSDGVGRPTRLALQTMTFVYCSIWQSPLFAVLLLRSGRSRFAMRRDDWWLLGMSILVANAGWTAIVALAGWAWMNVRTLLV